MKSTMIVKSAPHIKLVVDSENYKEDLKFLSTVGYELKKLRTLANVIKHGAGQSSSKLENLYPEFVYGNSASRSTKKGFAALTEPREIEAPMLNDEIAVSKDDVKSFLDSARKLLYELSFKLSSELSSELGDCFMCNDSSSEST